MISADKEPTINVHKPYETEEIHVIKNNACCPNRPVVITKNLMVRDGGDMYSCQCACGKWSTIGKSSPEEALKEYIRICNMITEST